MAFGRAAAQDSEPVAVCSFFMMSLIVFVVASATAKAFLDVFPVCTMFKRFSNSEKAPLNSLPESVLTSVGLADRLPVARFVRTRLSIRSKAAATSSDVFVSSGSAYENLLKMSTASNAAL